MTSSKGVSRHEFFGSGHRSRGGGGLAFSPANDPKQQQLRGYGGGAISSGSHERVHLPPALVRKLAEMLLPIVIQIAVATYPPIGPLIGMAYALYSVYQNKDKIMAVAQKISDDDIEGLAVMAAKEIAKQGVGAVAESAAGAIADKSAERLKDAGLFDEVPEAEGYYREFATSQISQLIQDKGEKFVDSL